MNADEKKVWNEVMPTVNAFLSRVRSLQLPYSVYSAVHMRILETVAFEPDLKRLLLASEFGIERVHEELKAECLIELRFRKQPDWFTIEFYSDPLASLAVVIHHEENRVSLFHAFMDLSTVAVEDVLPEGVPGGRVARLYPIFVHVLEHLGTRNEEGGVPAPVDRGEILPVNRGGMVLPPTEEKPAETKKPTAPSDECFHSGLDATGGEE